MSTPTLQLKGALHPVPCSPLLLFQAVYKSIFLLSSTLPALRRRQQADRPALTMGASCVALFASPVDNEEQV